MRINEDSMRRDYYGFPQGPKKEKFSSTILVRSAEIISQPLMLKLLTEERPRYWRHVLDFGRYEDQQRRDLTLVSLRAKSFRSSPPTNWIVQSPCVALLALSWRGDAAPNADFGTGNETTSQKIFVIALHYRYQNF